MVPGFYIYDCLFLQMEHLSHKALKPLLAETINETDTPRTKNLKFLRCKRLSFYGKRIVESFENNRPNSVIPRAAIFHSFANAKMDVQQSSDIINDEKHPLQRDSGVMHQRILQETSRPTTDEATCRRSLSSAYISKLDNKLLDDIHSPETQRLEHVSWAELFLDKQPNGEITFLDKNTKKGVVQNCRGHESRYERAENLDLQPLHGDVASEYCLEHGPPPLLNNNALSLTSRSNSTQLANQSREEMDTVVSTGVSGECEADDQTEQNTKQVSFQNTYIICKGDDLCTTRMDLHENFATYFWAPLNDSSDEEWPDAKTISVKVPDLETRDYKNSLKASDFHKPENVNCFSLPFLGDSLPFTKKADSCEKWNSETENLLEIKEYDKWNAFMWPLKPDCPSETNDTGKNILELAASGRIPLDQVKKDASRDKMLTFQLPKKDTDQRNEHKLEHVLGRDEGFERRKCTEEPADGISSQANCNCFERGTDFKSMMKDSATQISSFFKNPLPKLSENSACEVSPDCFNLRCESAANLCINYDCILEDILPQFGNDDNIVHISNTVLKPVQGYRNENVSKDASIVGPITSIVGPKNSSEESLNPSMNVYYCKKIFYDDWLSSDSSHDDSVLAKYYFYLNFLSESKRFQHDDRNHSFSSQECPGFSKDISMSSDGCHRTNDQNEHQEDTKYMNRATEESCYKDERTEVVRQHESHSEEETYLFANVGRNTLADLELPNKKQPENVHIPKDKKMPMPRKSDPTRHWQRASIAWSSYTHGEMKPRSEHVQRPATVIENTKSSYKAERSDCTSFKKNKVHLASDINRSNKNKKMASNYQGKGRNVLKSTNAKTESRQQHDSAFQGCHEIHLKSDGDRNLSLWLFLPDELWLCIFSFLSHKDISKVSQACRRFNQLAKDESFWKEIELTGCQCLNDEWLTMLGNHHPQCFSLDHCRDEHQRITDMGLMQFFQHCKGSLKELNIKGCSGPGFRGDSVLLCASVCCNHLTNVDVSWSGATDSGLSALIEASKSLQCLSVNGCQITDDAVTALVEKHGKSLKILEIFGCYAVTSKCLIFVAKKCPNLEVLNIGRVPKVNEDCLTKLMNSMKKLTSLNIAGLNTVRDRVVHFIVKKCPHLESLVLNSCSQVTDISLLEISVYLPTIRYLDVGGCQEVTDIGVQALAGSCHKLSYLDLSSTATSRRGVCLLASFCFRTLECVKLSFCKAITLDAVAKLCKNCKRLKILHLYGCYFMPDLNSIKKINKTVQVFHDLPIPAT